MGDRHVENRELAKDCASLAAEIIRALDTFTYDPALTEEVKAKIAEYVRLISSGTLRI